MAEKGDRVVLDWFAGMLLRAVGRRSTERLTPEAATGVSRERPPRPPFVSRTLVSAVAAVGVLAILALTFGGWMYASATVEVPDVTGIDDGVAETRIARAGLGVGSIERRFDRAPSGIVLSQYPPAGSLSRRGSSVALVVSGGTEEFIMPDVIGLGVLAARGRLEQSGLVVRVEEVMSEDPAGTVIETVPAPGARVRTSDSVRVRVATEEVPATVLLPYEMDGLLFVVDPELSPDAGFDVTLEVALRLRSLLEASGARVTVTRSVEESVVPDPVRLERALAATPTPSALIGLDAPTLAPGGLSVVELSRPATGTAGAVRRLADSAVRFFNVHELEVARGSIDTHVVSGGVQAPSIRVRLGSHAVPEDQAAFLDPVWGDSVARAIYRALGETFAEQATPAAQER